MLAAASDQTGLPCGGSPVRCTFDLTQHKCKPGCTCTPDAHHWAAIIVDDLKGRRSISVSDGRLPVKHATRCPHR
jgi:hypothetical protein